MKNIGQIKLGNNCIIDICINSVLKSYVTFIEDLSKTELRDLYLSENDIKFKN